MNKKIDIGQKAKVCLRWNVPQSNHSREEEKSMIALMAKKYGIPAKNITVEVNYTNANDGTLTSVEAQNIHDPKFMQELMKMWIADNGIKDVDFNEIIKIDSQINSLIDFDSYEKGKRYTIKWVKWSNFLSYGPDNFFDFTNLHGLVLLNGEPANKSGKSTFAYDLLHFLLFGKTNTNKAKTLGDLFNNYLPDANTLNVEGCINIDGEDYIIRRTLTRPSAGKKTKTVTNKVEYFRIAGDGSEEPLADGNEQGASTTATNQIIKDALGNESDFDLIISANAKDLDSLITETTETEKGRLLSRWIGLSVLEDKDVKARAKWNREISVGRFSDMYNQSQLNLEIEDLNQTVKEASDKVESSNKKIEECDKRISEFNANRDMLLSAKQSIDDSLVKVDAVSLQNSFNDLCAKGVKTKSDVEQLQKSLSEFGDVDYSEDEYRSLSSESNRLIRSIAETEAEIRNLQKINSSLANAEYCPTCHRKLDNVDNSAQIAANNNTISSLEKKHGAEQSNLESISKSIELIEKKRKASQEKSRVELKIAALNVELASTRADCLEKKAILLDIQKNKEAIAKNAEIEANLNVIGVNIKNEESIKKNLQYEISMAEREIAKSNETIALKKSYILKIEEERKVEKYWKLYLQMIGKDGISKMVLRNTLPIINNELNRLLDDVSDFRVEISMNDKNDIDFLLVRDGTITRLSAASGLEKTQAALALRVVLGKMSKLSRPPFILLDEVLGTVAKENYDDMKKLYDKIAQYYDFILHITHISDIVDWHESIVTVTKVDNISSIR